jgi:ABC-type sugar transport system ATPase subunit
MDGAVSSRTAVPTDRPAAPLAAVEAIAKEYPGVRALAGVSLDLRAGEVHALVGENGAGKSTLIRVLSGDTPPDAGTVQIDGKPVRFASPSDARRNGIVAIFQELMIVPDLSVAENVMLGNEPGAGGLLYARREAERKTAAVLRRLGDGMDIDPRRRAGSLSTAQKQIVEIARALVLDAPVIIMDEPTAALADTDAAALLRIIRQLRDEGRAILFVSHRLDEVRSIADRVTVLRGGEHIATLDAGDITETGQLIALMVGRPLAELFPPRNATIGEVVFAVNNLSRAGAFEDICFEVRAGEVLGVAGLIGAGRTEVMRAVFGADRRDAGTVVKHGRTLAIGSPRDAIAAGIAYLPEDRKDQGLVLAMPGNENLVMASLERHGALGFVSWPGVRRAARGVAGKLQFRGRLESAARTASGGNQQKLVIGKWVLSGADVLIFDEPTRGIDIGAKAEVYRLIHQLAGAGAAIVFVSSELPELMNVCHRMVVMSGGRIHDTLAEPEFEERRILAAAFAAHMTEPTAPIQPTSAAA